MLIPRGAVEFQASDEAITVPPAQNTQVIDSGDVVTRAETPIALMKHVTTAIVFWRRNFFPRTSASLHYID